MTDEINSYPLHWPPDWPRTPAAKRKASRFHSTSERSGYNGTTWRAKSEITISSALDRLEAEISRLGGKDLIVSTNVRSRLDGRPYSGERAPEDPGVAVYFTFRGKPTVLACDRWAKVSENIVAIAKHIEALRGQERWGVGSLERAFTGYAALPEPGRRNWREVLGWTNAQPIDRQWIEKRFRELVKLHHPDVGGDSSVFHRIKQAREDALEELARR